MLQFRRDLDLVEHLDRLGYDEFWCGEHHSSGCEMIGSPQMILAAAGERSKRINLATGIVSLPYHHPFNAAQRMVRTRPPSSPAPSPRSARRTVSWSGSNRCSTSPAGSGRLSASSTIGPTPRTRCEAGTWWRATWRQRSTAISPGSERLVNSLPTTVSISTRAREAVMAKITENPAAAAALAVTKSPLLAGSSSNVPDLNQAPDRLASG